MLCKTIYNWLSVLAWSCGRAKCQFCTATVTVVVYYGTNAAMSLLHSKFVELLFNRPGWRIRQRNFSISPTRMKVYATNSVKNADSPQIVFFSSLMQYWKVRKVIYRKRKKSLPACREQVDFICSRGLKKSRENFEASKNSREVIMISKTVDRKCFLQMKLVINKKIFLTVYSIFPLGTIKVRVQVGLWK